MAEGSYDPESVARALLRAIRGLAGEKPSEPRAAPQAPARAKEPARGPPVVHTVIDGDGHVAGRLASNVAKMLLEGRRVSVVNCEKVMISGRRSSIVREYREFLEISSILHPKHGPFHPRRPDTMLARMVRGMLPRTKPSGKTALSRLRTYVGTPRGLGAKIRVEKALIRRPAAGYTTMADLGRTVGWTE